jgi:hypothetical protein
MECLDLIKRKIIAPPKFVDKCTLSMLRPVILEFDSAAFCGIWLRGATSAILQLE